MKTIALTQNQVAVVDDADYEWLSQWKWCASGNRFVLMQFTGLRDKNGKDIYEGDILRTPGQQVLPVRIDDLFNGDAKFHHIEVAACEVIGNIYEHPSLLDG